MMASVEANIIITPTSGATTLANALIGPGVAIVGTPTLTGVTNQQGTFTNGNSSGIGFDAGVVLTSGNANDVPGPNNTSLETLGSLVVGTQDISTDLGTAGDAQLTSLAGNATQDANVLAFSFQFGDGTVGGDLQFDFVFASEEYVNFVGSQFNDVFGFFVDGINVALVPGTATPISVNTVNNSTNSAFYKNNVPNTNGITNMGLDLSFDGLTIPIMAQALGLGPGTHTMKFAVADTSDGILDAGVFIGAGSFSQIPEPTTIALLGFGLAGLGFLGRRRLNA